VTVTRQVALLRAVNVAGHNKVSMTELRAMFESLGHQDVLSFIQSGNVVFSSARTVREEQLEAVIRDRFGVQSTVLLRTGAELRAVLAANPFTGRDTGKLHVSFLKHRAAPAAVRRLDLARFRPDECVVRGREVYLFLPGGMGRAKLPAYVDRQLDVPATARNWNTVAKLAELAGSR
jgi:uncharacterized protein (DUF1697 family)